MSWRTQTVTSAHWTTRCRVCVFDEHTKICATILIVSLTHFSRLRHNSKTTLLREIARILSNDLSLNVVVVDKTCEIAGDGIRPHSAIGKARWMPVGVPNMQHVIMREADENESPDVIIVDEISTPQGVEAATIIAQRGVQLIATVHGKNLAGYHPLQGTRIALGGGGASR